MQGKLGDYGVMIHTEKRTKAYSTDMLAPQNRTPMLELFLGPTPAFDMF